MRILLFLLLVVFIVEPLFGSPWQAIYFEGTDKTHRFLQVHLSPQGEISVEIPSSGWFGSNEKVLIQKGQAELLKEWIESKGKLWKIQTREGRKYCERLQFGDSIQNLPIQFQIETWPEGKAIVKIELGFANLTPTEIGGFHSSMVLADMAQILPEDFSKAKSLAFPIYLKQKKELHQVYPVFQIPNTGTAYVVFNSELSARRGFLRRRPLFLSLVPVPISSLVADGIILTTLSSEQFEAFKSNYHFPYPIYEVPFSDDLEALGKSVEQRLKQEGKLTQATSSKTEISGSMNWVQFAVDCVTSLLAGRK